MQQSLFGSVLTSEPKPQVSDDSGVKSLRDALFTVIDVETTGLNPKKNALTEITAIQFVNGIEQAKYSTLVQPTEPIPPELEQLTGITNDMVRQAPSLISVLSELGQFIGPSPVIVGHNVGFDIRFIQEKFQQCQLLNMVSRLDLSRALCTKTLAVKLIPGLPSYEGIMVAGACGITNPNPHRAESDVRMSAGILFALIDKVSTQNPTIKTVKDLLDYQGVLT